MANTRYPQSFFRAVDRLSEEMGIKAKAQAQSLDFDATSEQAITLETKLFSVIQFGNRTMVRELLRRGADPNAFNGKLTAIEMALVYEQDAIAKLLKKAGATLERHPPKKMGKSK